MADAKLGVALPDQRVGEFLRDLGSGEPTPGGGAAAGVAGALAASLVAMVSRLTIGRAQYTAVEAEMVEIADQADRLQAEFLALAEDDAAAYAEFTAALKLPRSTDAEKATRAAARRAALTQATEVPLRLIQACRAVAQLAIPVAARGNQSARSDAISATLLAQTAARIGRHNVDANLGLLKDDGYASRVNAAIAACVDDIDAAISLAEGQDGHA